MSALIQINFNLATQHLLAMLMAVVHTTKSNSVIMHTLHQSTY